jgi:thymidylate synthase (FAD)
MMGYKASRDPGNLRETPLTRDVAFNRESMQDGKHISPFDNKTVQVGTDGIEVVLVQGIDEEALRRTLSMATRATLGVEIAEQWVPCSEHGGGTVCNKHAEHRQLEAWDWEGLVDPLATNGDWEEMLKGGLQTALESQVIVFAVRGVSRTATHQIVRTRQAAFHQQSQRASSMGDFPEFRMPESVWRNEAVRVTWLDALLSAHVAYQHAIREDIAYQDARFILPEGTTTFIMCEYTLREFLNVYAYRGCSMFQWEIVTFMRQAREILLREYPWLEPYIKISCEKTGPWRSEPASHSGRAHGLAHRCTFQGWEVVEGQCDFPWAKERGRIFRSDHYRIERSISQSDRVRDLYNPKWGEGRVIEIKEEHWQGQAPIQVAWVDFAHGAEGYVLDNELIYKLEVVR